MTRRRFVFATSSVALCGAPQTLDIPVHLIFDSRANLNAAQLGRFSTIWTEAVRDLARCGIKVRSTRANSEIRRSPSGAPVFVGLAPNVINMVVTSRIPTQWD